MKQMYNKAMRFTYFTVQIDKQSGSLAVKMLKRLGEDAASAVLVQVSR